MIRTLIAAVATALAFLAFRCALFAIDSPDGASAILFTIGALVCAVAAVIGAIIVAVSFDKRVVATTLLLLLTGCIGTVESAGHIARADRRLAAVEREREAELELSDCVVTSPSNPDRCARVTMRCTMGKGTRKVRKGVVVFAGGECVRKGGEVCR